VRVAVRPEFVDIAAAAPAGTTDNVVTGTVVGVAHQGETRQFLVDVGRERPLLVRRPTPSSPDLGTGDTAWCWWSPDHVHVFPADEAAPPSETPTS
jgi:spermidine/putrescine transport system ATP-binding protein